MRVGLQKPNVVDVNSKQDFPTLGSSIPTPVPVAAVPVIIPEAAASKRGKKKFSQPVEAQPVPVQS